MKNDNYELPCVTEGLSSMSNLLPIILKDFIPTSDIKRFPEIMPPSSEILDNEMLVSINSGVFILIGVLSDQPIFGGHGI